MDAPNILHIAADRAATSNPGLHGTVLITRPGTAASTLLVSDVSESASTCLDLSDMITTTIIFRSYSRLSVKLYDQYVMWCSVQKTNVKEKQPDLHAWA